MIGIDYLMDNILWLTVKCFDFGPPPLFHTSKAERLLCSFRCLRVCGCKWALVGRERVPCNDNSFGVNDDIKISLLLKPIEFVRIRSGRSP